jgi:predicted acyl esterase
MDMPPVLWTLRTGERLRLEISRSSFPSVAQHPNVYRNPWGERNTVTAHPTLHLGPDHPSRLVLQVDRKETRRR